MHVIAFILLAWIRLNIWSTSDQYVMEMIVSSRLVTKFHAY